MKIDIAGVLVDNISKSETLYQIDEFIKSSSPHYIVTTYSEFVVFAQKDPEFLKVINQADLSLPDGQGLIWAGNFLANEKAIKEKVSGSKLIWDIAKLASEKNYSMALVGGQDSVAKQAAGKLTNLYPNLKITLAISDKPFDDEIVNQIAASNSDILCIAYQPPRQEKWIAQNLTRLNVKVAIGLGGTFDYIAGKRIPAPDWLASIGLEWLWRLITQPWRIKRMWNAIFVFSFIVLKSKLNAGSKS